MKFQCKCGKEFNNPQSFNGHKSHCKAHQLAKYGSLTKMNKVARERSITAGKTNSKRYEVKKLEYLSQWIIEEHKCEYCGKIMTEKFGSGRFCSRTCANSRTHSEETKQKISSQSKKHNHPKKVCYICGKKIKNSNKTGLCVSCLTTTVEGKKIKIALGKRGYSTMKSNGTHKPWQSRKLTSYAEKFWKKVLDNNKISYQQELPVKHDNSNYFLDFYIEVNGKMLDLEIDGKQHQYEDRLESDKIRDKYLTSLGYIIYRIAWNEINSEIGRLNMQEKITKFLDFYKTLCN